MNIPKMLDILDEVLIQEHNEKKTKFKDYPFHHNPSSASVKINGKVIGACLRQLYYRAKKEPEVGDLDTTSVMQAGFGDAIHGWLQSKFEKSKKFSFTKEAKGKVLIDPLTKEVSFRIDGLILQENDANGGTEIKTVQGRAMTGKGWGIKDKGPKQDHLLQIIDYMNLNKSLKWFVLLYFARDSAYRLEYHITREGDKYFLDGVEIPDMTFAGIIERRKELELDIANDKAPNRDYKVWLKDDGSIQSVRYVKGDYVKSDFRCLFCPYKLKCWGEPDARKDSLNGA